MKKYFKLTAILLALCVVFYSCEDKVSDEDIDDDVEITDDDDDDDDAIIGRWQLFEAILVNSGGQTVFTYDTPCDLESWWEYKADGTLTIFNKCREETETYTWKRDGDVLTLIETGAQHTIISLTETELVLKLILDEGLNITYRHRRL